MDSMQLKSVMKLKEKTCAEIQKQRDTKQWLARQGHNILSDRFCLFCFLNLDCDRHWSVLK